MPVAKPPARFVIGPDKFKAERLNALEEFHCARRVAPLVKVTGGFVAVIASPQPEGEDGGAERLAGLIEASAPLTQALAGLSDEDADFVITRCMNATSMERDGEWLPAWDAERNEPAIAELRTVHILRICFEVLRDAISVFFSDALSSLTDLGLLARAIRP